MVFIFTLVSKAVYYIGAVLWVVHIGFEGCFVLGIGGGNADFVTFVA